MLHLSLLPFVLFAEHMSLAQLPCHLTAPQEEMALPLLRAINGPDGYSPSFSCSLSFLFLFALFWEFCFLTLLPLISFLWIWILFSASFNFGGFGIICSVTQMTFCWLSLSGWGLPLLLNIFTEKVWRWVSVRVYINIKRVVYMRSTLWDKHWVNTAKLELQSCFQ